MKVVILTKEQGNQVALCHKLKSHCEIATIVLSENLPRKAKPFGQRLHALASRISVRLLGRLFLSVWDQLQKTYRDRYPLLPPAPVVRVNNINDPETLEVLRQHQPDLIVVSGTNLVTRKTMEAAPPTARWINLHTGISPYVKGGPNCTNWCLAEQTFGLIGNTVMWLDPGIDSGNIIATEQTPLDGRETLFDLHWKVMEHAHDLYCRVVEQLAKGGRLPSVPQETIDRGRTFYNKEWNGLAARRALINFQKHYSAFFQNPHTQQRQGQQLKLFPLETES